MKKILVTGGAGFIGSHTVELLLKKNYSVRILDALQERVHPHGWPNYLPSEVEKLKGDVRSPDDWAKALVDIDGIIHLAAYQDYMTDFSTFHHVNTVGATLLYEQIVEKKLKVQKVVLASSQATYGEGSYRCPNHGLQYPPPRPSTQLEIGDWDLHCPECSATMDPVEITEDKVNPHTTYGISKYTAELTSFALGKKYNIPTTNLRYSIVQGARNSFYNAYSGICRIFAMRLINGSPPICYEDGNSLRDYVSVKDVANANVLCLEDSRTNGESYNVGGLSGISVFDFAQKITKKINPTIRPIISQEYRFGDTRHTISSWQKIGKLGWCPKENIDSIINEYVEWVTLQPEVKDLYTASQKHMRDMNVLRSVST